MLGWRYMLLWMQWWDERCRVCRRLRLSSNGKKAGWNACNLWIPKLSAVVATPWRVEKKECYTECNAKNKSEACIKGYRCKGNVRVNIPRFDIHVPISSRIFDCLKWIGIICFLFYHILKLISGQKKEKKQFFNFYFFYSYNVLSYFYRYPSNDIALLEHW